MNVKKPSLVLKEKAAEQPASTGPTRPKNPSANVLPTTGFVLQIDGKFKSEYETGAQAMKAAEELKKKYPYLQVIAYWPAPGSEDTELGVLMGPEVGHGEAEVHARVQA